MMSFDYIIVGAGSAGCVLANRLTENPDCRVLLIEAGGEATGRLALVPGAAARLQDTTLDWGFRTTPQAHLFDRIIPYARGRAVGGTSVLNYLLYIRGSRGDYDHWRQLGNAGWAYDDVLPYFKRAENNASIRDDFHGGDGPLHVENQPNPPPLCEIFFEAAQSIGIPFNPDFNGASQEGCGYYQTTLKNGRRCSTAFAYIEPIRSRPNFRLVRNAIVTRLIVESGRARGVEYIADGRVIERADADVEVICAAGAIGTPHLMMLSGLGPADHLAEHGIRVEADLPGVGRDLQDHMGSLGVRATVRDPDAVYGAGPGDFASCLDQFERNGSGPLATNGVEAGAFLRADESDAEPSLQCFFHACTAEFFRTNGVADRSHFHMGHYVCRPRSRGSVTLASANPLDRPLIDPNYLSDPDDLRLSIAGIHRNVEIMRARPFGKVRGDLIDPDPTKLSKTELENFVRRSGSTTWHPTSTCRMGSDDQAVVDAQLRVHGVAGLRICDASVMPTLVSGNTNAPVIMIAEKSADLIRGCGISQNLRL
jgi:choline dehydrogenase